jgi:hypothetical protein
MTHNGEKFPLAQKMLADIQARARQADAFDAHLDYLDGIIADLNALEPTSPVLAPWRNRLREENLWVPMTVLPNGGAPIARHGPNTGNGRISGSLTIRRNHSETRREWSRRAGRSRESRKSRKPRRYCG